MKTIDERAEMYEQRWDCENELVISPRFEIVG